MYIDDTQSAKKLGYDYKKYIEHIADNMIKTRPMKDVDYRPYLAQKGVKNLTELYFDEISLEEYYPEAQEGDFVYLRVGMTSETEKELVATVAGNVELFYRGKSILKTKTVETVSPENYEYVPVMLEKGINELVIKCTYHNGSFKFYFLTALGLFILMKARDYLFHSRTVIAKGEYCGEEGYEISRLYKKGETPSEIKYVYPAPTQENNKIDFSLLNKNDKFAMAVTYASKDTEIVLVSRNKFTVYVNKKETFCGTSTRIIANSGDEISVVCSNEGDCGFCYSAENIGIPFLISERKNGINWLLLTLPEAIENPAKKIDYKTPYEIEGEKRFWRFQDGSFLRINLETSFFGQWFYALMVGNYGLLNAAKATGRNDYLDYFISNMKTMVDYYEYSVYDATLSGEAAFLQRGAVLDNLDAIGTMGMNFIEYYNLTHDENTIPVIKKLENAMLTKILRFPDGTFRRETTMWADDTFMSCPFLVRLAALFQNDKYYDELKTQLSGFKKRLYMEDKRIFSHIFFPDTGLMNRIPWGRGNGWIMLTLTEILGNISKEHPDYGFYSDMLKEFAEGVLTLQDENGMWHQVLDIKESYIEASSTSMFVLCFSRGIKMGILDKEAFGVAAKRGIDALLKFCIDKNGNLYGVCKGSGCSMDAKYYTQLETAYNDDHGTGIVLCALAMVSEIDSLL